MKLTKPQQLIYDSEKVIGGAFAVMCGIMTVDKVYPKEQVVEAIKKIYETNDALNYRLDESGFEPQMYYESPAERKVDVIYVNTLSELDEIGKEVASTPFDLKGWLSELTAVIRPDGYGIIIKVHHLLGDAWSMSLIATQLNEILEGTPYVRYSYEDYINAEKEYLNSKKYTRDRQFFLSAFEQCSEPVMLSDKVSSDYRVKKLFKSIDNELLASLRSYAEKSENSEFVVLFSAFAVLYGKLKNCADRFFVGMPVLNRMSQTDLNTVGMYINTVPVPVCLDYGMSFADNLQEINNTIFSVFKHQKYNYNDILRTVSDEFGYQGKLYDCAVNYQPDEILSDEAMRSTDYSRLLQPENLQLLFHNRNRESGLEMEYEYRTAVFSEDEVEHFNSMFLHVLKLLLKNDEQPLKDISLISDDERKKLLYDFNNTAVPYDKNKNVYDLFIEQADKTPEQTAVTAADRELTYAELKNEAARLANGLTERGIGVGDIVAFCLPRDSRLLTTMLGILQSGAAYLPLDTQLPNERLEYILNDSKAKLCITEENYDEMLSTPLDMGAEIFADSICYCIYTSGSTGMPKGTLLTHGNAVNYINSGEKSISAVLGKECKTVLSVTSVGFDIFVTESLLPLVNGKRIILADESQSQFGAKLQSLLNTHQVDAIQTTPSKMRVFLQNMPDKTCIQSLKYIILGGETLDRPLVEQLKALSEAEIYNVYGPTEATVWATCAKVNDAEEITIGKPLANTQIYILDKYLMPVPLGETGELCIAGDCVCPGYLNRDDLTTERFIDNPFGDGKLYKTGDLAYWRNDGNIVFVGRNDFQVKINGQRVELGEIESALSSLDGVDSAAVTVNSDENGSKVICAYYTGKEESSNELRSKLSRSLPRYMLPQIFVHLEDMPLNTSGKIDRSALPAPDFKNADSSAEYIAAQTDAEKILTSTAMQLLKCERIGMLDNFFDLGGDSLKSIAWISLLEQNGYTLSPSDIFSSANMNELKEKMRPTDSRKFEEPTYPDRLPLTSVQTEIYTAQSVAPNKPVYNIPYAVSVESLDVDKLQYAVNCMLKQHEILRTRFENIDGELSQIIDEQAVCSVEQIDGDIAGFIRPFDLSKAPLLRVGYKDNTVIFDMHHLIADGSSMPIFFRELNEYYMGREPIESTVPYKYFAVTQNNADKDNNFWLEQFNGDVPSLNLNTDYPRPAIPTYDGESLYFHMSKSEYEKIEAFCKAENITPFVYYYGAFQILIQKFSGQEDIIIGTPMSGRTSENIGTIGMFVRTLPLRCRPEGRKTAGQFFREVRELSVTASQHSEFIPSAVAKIKKRTSLFDVMFTYQAEEMTNLLFADKPAELMEISLPASKYDLSFDIYPRDDSIVLSVTYNTSLFRKETMLRMESAYEKILTEALSANIQISDISVMNDAEKDRILYAFNNTAIPYDNDKSVYDLFVNQVRASNNKAYIKDETSHHSFAELENDAAKIDARIRNTVGNSKQVIGVLCDRSYEELAAIYGIIRGGNAYMPISPQYPEERIRTILESSGCNMVIAQKKYCHFTDSSYSIEDILSGTDESDIPEPAAMPEDTLYVIFTSGSTGIPKGVMVSNRSAVNRIEWMKNKLFDSSSVVMLKTPYTFDVSVWEIFGFGMYGFSLYILPEDEHYNQTSVLNHIEKGQVTDLHFVPTVFEQFLSVLRNNPDTKSQLKSIRHIILSGESLSAKAVNEFSSYHDGQITVHNLYGPAECAVDVTSYDCTAHETDPIPIGKPIANTQMFITDKYMNPVPLGVIGELCIGGVNVGQGYLNRADLTAERFIDNPFGDGKLYKTGDLAYWRNDGNIVFVGRNDFQVKINGQRVELGEIESALSSQDGVDSAAVTVNSDENGGQVICAYYTGNEISSNELRDKLSRSLPRYMLPQIFVHLEDMPLNSSGKADRKMLSQIPVTAEKYEQSYEAPKTQREEEICYVFREVLSADRIGRNDNFYDFGGTSLQLVRLLSRPPLDALSASDFLADPTPAGLAKRLNEISATDSKYIVPLYTSDSSDKAVILFPYAGGDASAYTALISKSREKNIDISLYFVGWPEKHGMSEIAQEIRDLAAEKRVCFYSHCAGSAVAMALLDILNKESTTIQGYIAAANIPPSKSLAGFNIWKYMTDKRIIKTLMRAGLELENDDSELLNGIVKRFRQQTKLYNSYFSGKKEKTNIAVTVVISKKDPFTYNYTKAETLWQRVTTDVNKVIYIDTPSHYFVKSHTDLLLELFAELPF